MAMVVAHNNYRVWDCKSYCRFKITVTEDEISKLPTLELLFGDYWLQVLPEDYILFYENDS